MTTAREIHMRNAISKSQFAITRETIEHERQSLVAFNIAGTFEKFIKRTTDEILR